ncbi:hypothetical protein ACGF12_13815 [Kitasatospora sp. NPDC048296]|uniref:hypothetical protein n=1 Tax=Kitasatospora sp. NPDC048296 TaxID=3364048 RepID=UPI0037106FD2
MLHDPETAVTKWDTAIRNLAVFAALAAIFEGTHDTADQWAQRGADAVNKGLYGDHLVLADGSPASPQDIADPLVRTMSATTLGRISAARHVLCYGAVQTAATLTVTRALGFRPRPAALLAGAAINLGTHLIIDRRRPLLRLAVRVGKGDYVKACTVVRAEGKAADSGGPGTALFELDQALHRTIGLAAAAVSAALAVRNTR